MLVRFQNERGFKPTRRLYFYHGECEEVEGLVDVPVSDNDMVNALFFRGYEFLGPVVNGQLIESGAIPGRGQAMPEERIAAAVQVGEQAKIDRVVADVENAIAAAKAQEAADLANVAQTNESQTNESVQANDVAAENAPKPASQKRKR